MKQGLTEFLFEIGQLKRVRRSGWWLAGIRDAESVADHSYRTAVIAYLLAQLEGADGGKAAALALFHDTAETRVNDLHRLGKSYVDWSGVEAKVVEDQVSGLPEKLAESIRSLTAEVRAKESTEARIVKDADQLECLLQAREYAEQGYDVEEWIRNATDSLTTESAKAIARDALEISPASWRERTAE